MSKIYQNSGSGQPSHTLIAEWPRVEAFFRDHPMPPTPLVRLDGLAAQLGVASIELKDESRRLGMNAFKVVGVTYAVSRLEAQGQLGDVLACATDGNHGRAVAGAARQRGRECHVFVPSHMAAARKQAIRTEGATVHSVEGTYDDAVKLCSAQAETHGWMIVSDTAWDGYEEIPQWIMSGYSWIAEESSNQWSRLPDVVLLQAGVGGFACGIINWFLSKSVVPLPRFVIVEPLAAACVFAAAETGSPIHIPGSLRTLMAGLSCGEASPAAWSTLKASASAFLAVQDEWSARAMRSLAHPVGGDPVVVAGESGAAGLAGLLALKTDPALAGSAADLGLDRDSHVLVINTEGDTDPISYREIIGAGSA